MADIIAFDAYRDPADINREERLAYLETLRARIAELDETEPEDMESEEYDAWGDAHEELEDLVDEVLDLLDGN